MLDFMHLLATSKGRPCSFGHVVVLISSRSPFVRFCAGERKHYDYLASGVCVFWAKALKRSINIRLPL